MDWIDKTISPLPAEACENVRLALALAIGPDPVTMLKDVAGIEAERTRRVLKWAARAMLGTAVELDGRSEAESPQAGYESLPTSPPTLNGPGSVNAADE